MSDPPQQGAAGDATPTRFRFSLAQFFGVVLILCLVLGTFRLLMTWQDSPVGSCLIALFGFGGALVIYVRVVTAGGQRRTQLVEYGAMVATTCLLAVCLMSAVRYAKERSHRPRCYNNLRQIAIALQMYHDEYRSLPPAYVADAGGKPIHSWRVLLLPFLECEPLYKQYRFDEPWDGPNNRKLHDRYLEVYTCPEQFRGAPRDAARDTSYVVVVGPQTAFPGDRSVSFGDIRDGTTNTVLVVEINNSGIHWMEPRDLHVTQMNPRINPPRGQGISSLHKGYAGAALADGGVKTLSEQLSASEVAGSLTIDGGEPMLTPEQ